VLYNTTAHLQQDVFQLDVPVCDALLVAVVDSDHDLLEEPPAAPPAAAAATKADGVISMTLFGAAVHWDHSPLEGLTYTLLRAKQQLASL
jgi:hypothetical protein